MKREFKSLAIISASLIASSCMIAQNTSYNANTIGIGGSNNVAFGLNTMGYNTGSDNSALGISSLGYNTTGSRNTGCGLATLASNTTGSDNTGIGFRGLQVNTTGFGNTAVGSYVLYSNLTGAYNIGIGYQTLQYNTSGSSNVAMGYQSLNGNTASGNTALGHAAMFNNASGAGNVAVGTTALGVNSSGSSNVAVGSGAMYANFAGSNNTAIGTGALDSYGGSNNTALGYNADVNANNLTNATAVGNGAIVNASNKIRLGDVNVTVIEGQPLVYTGSDGRFKTSIQEGDVKGLEFIKRLRPVVYNFETKKFQEFLTKNMPDSVRKNYLNQSFEASTAVRRSGFIAQEVEKAANEVGYNFDAIHKPQDENDNYSLAYGQFVVPLVKAVQEQQAMIEDLKTANALQQQQIEELLNKTTTGIGTTANAMEGFALSQNIPNPFTSETVIKYTLTAQTKSAVLNVYDLSGKQITSFSLTGKGASSITLTSEKLAAGIYIYSVVADGKIMDSKRMVVSEK